MTSAIGIPVTFESKRERSERALYDWRVLVLAVVLSSLVTLVKVGLLEFMLESRWWNELWLACSFTGMVALFLPGALLRRKWHHCLVMVVFAGATLAVREWLAAWYPEPPHLFWPVRTPLTDMVAIGAGEFLLVGRESRRQGFWVAGACLAGSMVFAAAHSPVWLAGWDIGFGGSGQWSPRISIAEMMYWPLLAVLAWTVIPVGMRMHASGPRTQLLGLLGIGAVLTCYVVFFDVVVLHWARRSVLGEGPFPRHVGVQVLHTGGRDSDHEVVWEALEDADWTEEAWRNPDPLAPDWRKTAVRALVEHDRSAAAERLAVLVERHPDALPVLLGKWCQQILKESESRESDREK